MPECMLLLSMILTLKMCVAKATRAKPNNYLLSLKMQIITNLQPFMVNQSINSDLKLLKMILVLLPDIKSFQPCHLQI